MFSEDLKHYNIQQVTGYVCIKHTFYKQTILNCHLSIT